MLGLRVKHSTETPDRQRARGPQAVESPLLWSDEELQQLLQGRV